MAAAGEPDRFRFSIAELMLATAAVGCLLVMPSSYGCHGQPRPWTSVSTIEFCPDRRTLFVELYEGITVTRNNKTYDIDCRQSVFEVDRTSKEHTLIHVDHFGTAPLVISRTRHRIALNGDGDHVAVTTRGGWVILHAISSGQATQLPIWDRHPTSLSWIDDTVYVASDWSIAGYPLHEDVMRLYHGHNATHCVVFDDNLRCAIANEYHRRVTLLRFNGYAESSVVQRLGHGESARVHGLALSADASHVALAHEEGVSIWDVSTGEKLEIEAGAETFAVAWAPDNNVLAVAGKQGVSVFDIASGEQVGQPLTGRIAHSVSFSPDGSELAAGIEPATLAVWDWKAGRMVYRTRLPSKRRINVLIPGAAAAIITFIVVLRYRKRTAAIRADSAHQDEARETSSD